MELIKGAEVVAALNKRLAAEVEKLTEAGGRPPKLAILRVGEQPDQVSYERGARKRMDKIGISHQEYVYPADMEKELFYQEFDRINVDSETDGILLLRPLPAHLEEKELERRIDPAKDVDGISPINQAKVMAGEKDGFAPCTPEAVIEVLEYAGVNLSGKRVTVVGRSMVVGKPLSLLLLNRHATVTICHTRTKDLPAECRRTEILIAAAGRPRLLTAEHVGEQTIVIDVGINVDENGKLCGDVDLASLEAAGAASAATPVPGGVGTVTTSVLAKHVLEARLRK